MNEPFGQFVLQLGKLKDEISEADYFEICQINEFLVIEREHSGDWEIKSLNGLSDGQRNSELAFQVGRWSDEDKSGICFGAFTGFTLPNGATRAADFTWLKREKWECLSREQKEKFAPVAPDFVVEICGYHESVKNLQNKMREYIENGVSLGWLIDPQNKRVYVYRPDFETKVLENQKELSGEPLLKSFLLNLQEIWD